MQLPQSVAPNNGGGGAAGGLDSAGAALGASAAADADSAGAADSEAAGSAELVAEELWSAALSGGLDSPPHANQASGTAATRTKAAIGAREA
jgi:hypothetical protein